MFCSTFINVGVQAIGNVFSQGVCGICGGEIGDQHFFLITGGRFRSRYGGRLRDGGGGRRETKSQAADPPGQGVHRVAGGAAASTSTAEGPSTTVLSAQVK